MDLTPFSKLLKMIEHFKIVKNKSRQHFLSSLVQGVISSRSIIFSTIASEIPNPVKISSKERTIQDFFQKVSFNYRELTYFLMSFISHKKLRLTIDRTEWDFGKTQINILCIVAQIGKMGVPLYFEMLDNKSGNSHTTDRIAILKEIISIVGIERIEVLIMDREFIGNTWLSWLKKQKIPFCVRVPKSHYLLTKQGDRVKAETLLKRKSKHYLSNVIVNGVSVNCYLSKDKKGEILYIIGTIPPKEIPKIYKKRWAIEVVFQALKSRGFNIEESKLKCIQKYKKLFAVVVMAYTICWAVGIQKSKRKPVKTKKHGYPQYSVFRRGLNCIKDTINNYNQIDIEHTFDNAILRIIKTIKIIG